MKKPAVAAPIKNNTPSDTPTPMPIFAPSDRPPEESGPGVAVAVEPYGEPVTAAAEPEAEAVVAVVVGPEPETEEVMATPEGVIRLAPPEEGMA